MTALALHRLDPAPDTVTDVFSRDLPPVLTIDPGDTVVVRSLDAGGHLERQLTPGVDRSLMFNARRGHVLTGPIAIRGAEPGMMLAIRLVNLRPDTWGFTNAAARDTPLNRRLGLADASPCWLLWELDADKLTATNDRGHTVDLAPFLGVIGLTPEQPGEHSTRPPRPTGGNIDCRDLVAGSTLYLPVTVPEALLCIGDGHGAQGDGEVSGTAIETGMTTELTVDLVTDPPIPTVHAVTPTSRITFGFNEDLNEAMAAALDAMLAWMQTLFNLDKAATLALASPTVDLRVTQVANDVWGVHAVLPHDAIR
jgi:acetamidase/formamidase